MHLSESVGGLGLDFLVVLIETDELHYWLWLETIQPVEELCQHLQSFLLGSLHIRAYCRLPVVPPIYIKILLLEYNGIIEGELGSAFERLWDCVLSEYLKGGTDAGEYEGNIVG